MKYLEQPELTHLSEVLEFESAECRVHTRFEVYSCKSVSRERKLFKTLEQAYSLDAAEHDEMLLSLSPEMQTSLAAAGGGGASIGSGSAAFKPGEGLESCFGKLGDKDNRQTWFWLIALLNVAYPDHDFTSVRPDHFVRENSVNDVLRQLSATVMELNGEGPRSYGSYPSSTNSPLPHHLSSSSFPSSFTTSSNLLSSSHSTTSHSFTHPHLQKLLDAALLGSLAETEVYSYTPDADSDPHAESDSEGSEDDEDEDRGDDGGEDDGMMMMDDEEGVFAGGFDEDYKKRGGRGGWVGGAMGGLSRGGSEGAGLGSGSGRRRRGSGRRKKGTFGARRGMGSGFKGKGRETDESQSSDEDDDDDESETEEEEEEDSEEEYSEGDDGFNPPSLEGLPLVDDRDFTKGGGGSGTGCLWSVNYFFVSRRQKRILFVSCWAKRRKGGRRAAFVGSSSLLSASTRLFGGLGGGDTYGGGSGGGGTRRGSKGGGGM